jgi:hypothetical protein
MYTPGMMTKTTVRSDRMGQGEQRGDRAHLLDALRPAEGDQTDEPGAKAGKHSDHPNYMYK